MLEQAQPQRSGPQRAPTAWRATRRSVRGPGEKPIRRGGVPVSSRRSGWGGRTPGGVCRAGPAPSREVAPTTSSRASRNRAAVRSGWYSCALRTAFVRTAASSEASAATCSRVRVRSASLPCGRAGRPGRTGSPRPGPAVRGDDDPTARHAWTTTCRTARASVRCGAARRAGRSARPPRRRAGDVHVQLRVLPGEPPDLVLVPVSPNQAPPATVTASRRGVRQAASVRRPSSCPSSAPSGPASAPAARPDRRGARGGCRRSRQRRRAARRTSYGSSRAAAGPRTVRDDRAADGVDRDLVDRGVPTTDVRGPQSVAQHRHAPHPPGQGAGRRQPRDPQRVEQHTWRVRSTRQDRRRRAATAGRSAPARAVRAAAGARRSARRPAPPRTPQRATSGPSSSRTTRTSTGRYRNKKTMLVRPAPSHAGARMDSAGEMAP